MPGEDYDPLTGANWDLAAARQAWGKSMSQANQIRPCWNLRGDFPAFYWSFFNFKSYTGRVTVEADGFHWSTQAYDNRAGDEVYHEGVTTSLYEAYQSVEQNRVVRFEAREGQAHGTASELPVPYAAGRQ